MARAGCAGGVGSHFLRRERARNGAPSFSASAHGPGRWASRLSYLEFTWLNAIVAGGVLLSSVRTVRELRLTSRGM